MAEADGDGLVSVEEVYSFVERRVASHADELGKAQHLMLSDDYPGELELFRYVRENGPGLPSQALLGSDVETQGPVAAW